MCRVFYSSRTRELSKVLADRFLHSIFSKNGSRSVLIIVLDFQNFKIKYCSVRRKSINLLIWLLIEKAFLILEIVLFQFGAFFNSRLFYIFKIGSIFSNLITISELSFIFAKKHHHVSHNAK